jgi:V/A-type H+-transporting ATPase subunit E
MQKVAEARLKAKQMIVASREELINETLEKAKQKLLEMTTSKDYEKTLRKMIEEGGLGLGGGELEVTLPGKGARTAFDLNVIAKQVEKVTGKPTTIKIAQEKSKLTGGAIISKADGSIAIDNSFEARIDRAMREIRIKVAKLLFE